MPAASADVVKVATPAASVPVPIEDPPSRKVTDPVAVPAPGATAETVAVNVTDCPNADGFSDEVSAVVEPAWLTTCGLPVSEPVLPLKLVSPP